VDTSAVLNIGAQALWEVAKLAAPIVITALIVGFAVSLLQSITQIQEITLSFVPKALAVALALMVCGNWMISDIVTYTQQLVAQIPTLIGSSGG
jgi:flagellar biosynthetic protein FliQ